MNEAMKEKLKKLAARKCWIDDEDFCVCDYCGSNYDDAYSGGCSDGEALLARDLLEEFGDA